MTFSHALILVAALSAALTAAADDINDPTITNTLPQTVSPIEEEAVISNTPLENTLPPETTVIVDTNDLWQRVRGGFAMPIMDTDLVHRHENQFASKPEYLQRLFARSGRYLYFVVEEVQKRGIPTEIALLPMIESAYNPKAYSHAKASGIWQFIPTTGTHYGLEQTWWYDGRRDIYAATTAALDYLTVLHNMFGDWQLALAAYNWGEGSVQRAIARNQAKGLPTDYASLNMPAETRHYVPKLMAIRNLVSNPESFGITLPPVENKPYFAVISTTRHIDLELAAKFADMSVDDFLNFNPAYNQPVIAYKPTRKLLVPIAKVEAFNVGLANHPETLLNWQAYQVMPGDTIDRLAVLYDTNPEQLQKINRITKQRLKPGQLVLVPRKTESAALAKAAPLINLASTQTQTNQEQSVKDAEPAPPQVTADLQTLASVAPSSPPENSAENLIQISGIESSNAIIPQTTDAEIASAKPEETAIATIKPSYHKVVKGDTAFSIAHRYGLSLDELVQINQLKNTKLMTGSRLNISTEAASSLAQATISQRATAKTKTTQSQYKVQPGDTAFGIARRFKVDLDELLTWNGLKQNSILKPGNQITVSIAKN